MISIIVPIYNAEEYLPRCIESLQAQTIKEPLQFILVDDGSTDGSLAMLHSYAAKDPRIEVYEQEHAGQSVARNRGMEHIKGEYVAFVDADDSLAPNWCERHMKAIHGVDYVQSGYRRSSEKSDKSKELWWHVGRRRLPRSRYQYTSPCMRLYRREAIENLRFPKGMIYEDILFSTDLWLSGATCRMINYTGYLYTVNPNSTTAHRHPQEQRHVLRELQKKMKGQSLHGKWIIFRTLVRLQLHFLQI